MKIFVLAMLLAVMQTSTPAPRKTVDPSNGAAKNVKRDSGSSQSPSQQPQAIVEPITANPDQNGGHRPATENTQNPIVVRELPTVSVTKDRLDKLYIAFTGILILVGALGVKAAFKTLGEMKAQREAMQGQLKVMQGQVAQMEIAGRQTDSLITQARKSADAAWLNAESAISAERPWIVTDAQTKEEEGIFVAAIIRGRTTANIISQWAGYTIHPNEDSLPGEPSYGDHGTRIDHPLLAFPDQQPLRIYQYPLSELHSDADRWKRIIEAKLIFFAFGRLLYTDTLSKNADGSPVVHETRWCYRYLPPPVTQFPRGFLRNEQLLGSLVKGGKAGYNRYT